MTLALNLPADLSNYPLRTIMACAARLAARVEPLALAGLFDQPFPKPQATYDTLSQMCDKRAADPVDLVSPETIEADRKIAASEAIRNGFGMAQSFASSQHGTLWIERTVKAIDALTLDPSASSDSLIALDIIRETAHAAELAYKNAEREVPYYGLEARDKCREIFAKSLSLNEDLLSVELNTDFLKLEEDSRHTLPLGHGLRFERDGHFGYLWNNPSNPIWARIPESDLELIPCDSYVEPKSYWDLERPAYLFFYAVNEAGEFDETIVNCAVQSANAQRKYNNEHFGGRSQPMSFQIYVPPSPWVGLPPGSKLSTAQEDKYIRLCNLLEEAGVQWIEGETLLPSAPPANAAEFAQTFSRWVAEVGENQESDWDSPLGVLESLDLARLRVDASRRNPPVENPAFARPLTAEALLERNQNYATLLKHLNQSQGDFPGYS